MATLRIDGSIQDPLTLDAAGLASLGPEFQVSDVQQLDPRRAGRAVKLEGLLSLVRMDPSTNYLGLHAEADNFHASIPLDLVRQRAVVIYAQPDGTALPASAGGPFRLLIPDHAVCHTAEIDECANVKYLDRIELQVGRGVDNRPRDDDEHARLHANS